MKILIVLNYYWPYISGLSECAREVAEKLAVNNEVTVLTSRHSSELPLSDNLNGVKIIRTPIMIKINKGVISPQFVMKYIKLQKEADIVNFHMPMAEAGLLSMFTPSNKLCLTYQCDVHLPSSLINKIICKAMDTSSKMSFKRASKIVIASEDYAYNSRVLPAYKDKWVEIHPTSPAYKKIKTSSSSHNNDINIGFCGRIVEEKGIDILLKVAPKIKEKMPNAKFLIAGDYLNVAGGSIYDQLKRDIGWDESYVHFLGRLSDDQLVDFYKSLNLFVLPSINSLEAFGMVQVEAMLAGVPVIATDLPGVRVIVTKTGMGEIVERKNPQSLMDGILKVLQNPEEYRREREYIEEMFGNESAARKYEDLFVDMVK